MPAPIDIQSRDDVAYLLVGHGTRNAAGQRQFENVYQQFAQLLTPKLTGFAYLELAEPSIEQSIARLADQGAREIVTVPVLLFAAGHALQDIPAAALAAAGRHGLSIVGQTAPLELNPAIVELSALRFRQALCQTANLASCFESCERTHCTQIGLAMIGRGSRSDEATERMRQFSALRSQITPVRKLETGFVYAQSPPVDEVLRAMAGSSCATIVVQPHLLFEGELMEQLRQRVATIAAENPSQRWVITASLGTDFALARTLTKLVKEPLMCN